MSECSCRPVGEHLVNCRRFIAYEHKVLEEYRRIKKELKNLKKSKVGNSEIFKPRELYYYAITLTGNEDYTKIIKSITKSKMFHITQFCYGEERNANDKEVGWYHIHILTRGTKFIDAKEVFVKNKKQRVDVKLLKDKISLTKWHRYIHKENIFGECPVDTDGSKIKILGDNNGTSQEKVYKTI